MERPPGFESRLVESVHTVDSVLGKGFRSKASPWKIDRVFERFEIGSEPEQSGLGLGIAIVKEMLSASVLLLVVEDHRDFRDLFSPSLLARRTHNSVTRHR